MDAPVGFEVDAREGLSTRALSAKYSMSQTRAKRLRQELTGEAPVRARKQVMCGLEVQVDADRLDEILELATHEEALEIVRRHITEIEQKKEHPCFVPYQELPANQRLKDHMFGLVVRAVLFG